MDATVQDLGLRERKKIQTRDAIRRAALDLIDKNGYANTTINGVQYRVRTFSAGSASIALAAPLAEAQHRINELHLRVLLICGGVIGGTFLVGWVISLIMVNPFLLLAQQARAISAQSSPD